MLKSRAVKISTGTVRKPAAAMITLAIRRLATHGSGASSCCRTSWISDLATLSISAHSSGEAGSVTGYPLTTEVTIDAFLGYASRRYRIPEDFAADWRMLVLPPAPPSKRGGVIFPIENGQWLVTLGGYARDYPPTDDEAAFMAFAKDLRSPLLHQAIQNAEPLAVANGNQDVQAAFLQVIHLQERPAALFHPRVLLPALARRHAEPLDLDDPPTASISRQPADGPTPPP